MEERLKEIFANVNDWLKFAEAKNGVLVAFNGSALVLVMSTLLNKENLTFVIHHWYLIVLVGYFIFFAALGLIIALLSFLAQISPTWFRVKEEPKDTDNLLFYRDIAKYDKNNVTPYLEKLSHIISPDREEEMTQMEKLYANQIITNSQIAVRKYKFFNASLWCTILAFTTPLGAAIAATLNKEE